MDKDLENVTLQFNLLDRAAVGLCLLRSDWVVLFWNHYLEQYTKISKAEIVGTSLFCHFDKLNIQTLKAYGDQVFQQKREVEFLVPLKEWHRSHLPPEKESILLKVSLTPVSAIPGEDNGLLTLQPSIFPYPSGKADHQPLELEEFINRIAHDLQEPLRMVINFNQLLQQRYRQQLNSNAHQIIHFAVDGGLRMQQMIDGLLVYSRLKLKQKPYQWIQTKTALEAAIINLQPLIMQTQAQIQMTDLPEVMADQQQFTQLFTILIENAIQYCRDRPPKIEITVQSQAEFWVFSVQDNGMGIDPKNHHCIFEIFYRLHSRKDYAGIGMGLAIAKRIVELHQGCIWVSSQIQQGSTFYFTIPRLAQIYPVLNSPENL